MTDDEDLAVLRSGLDQLSELLAEIGPEDASRATPCEEWTVRELVDHVVAAPANFTRMVRGESIDWSAATPSAGDDPAATLRSHADDLVRALSDSSGEGPGPEWQCAEIAVHTWDLATALGKPTDGLDPRVAERGLAFMQDNLTAENRSPAFGAAKPAPEGANAYERIAAFAGRSV